MNSALSVSGIIFHGIVKMMTALVALLFCRVVSVLLFLTVLLCFYIIAFFFSAANILYMASQEMIKVVERDSTTIKQNLKKVTV